MITREQFETAKAGSLGKWDEAQVVEDWIIWCEEEGSEKCDLCYLSRHIDDMSWMLWCMRICPLQDDYESNGCCTQYLKTMRWFGSKKRGAHTGFLKDAKILRGDIANLTYEMLGEKHRGK